MEIMKNFLKKYGEDYSYDSKTGEFVLHFRGYDRFCDAAIMLANLLKCLRLDDEYGRHCFGIALDSAKYVNPRLYFRFLHCPQSNGKECTELRGWIKNKYFLHSENAEIADVESTVLFISKLVLSFLNPEYDYRYIVIDKLFNSMRFENMYIRYAGKHREIFSEICEDAKRCKWKPEYAVDRYVDMAVGRLREELSQEEIKELFLD